MSSSKNILAWLSAVALILSSTSVARAQEAQQTWILAPGSISCATYMSRHQRDVEIYILGYWSGLNVKNDRNHMVGSTTDAPGIIAEVRLTCTQEPSITVWEAINRVYWRMDAARR
jgi:hypothetical protein